MLLLEYRGRVSLCPDPRKSFQMVADVCVLVHQTDRCVRNHIVSGVGMSDLGLRSPKRRLSYQRGAVPHLSERLGGVSHPRHS